MTDSSANQIQTATLGGGCFWCMEPVFRDLQGVEDVTVGYAGGKTPQPDYQLVCTGTTGHAEVVQIQFDSRVISYRDILEVFFSVHDPTTLNRQGADVGTQYRSIILYHNEEQKKTAGEVIHEITAEGLFPNPVVTEVLPFQVFYRAEDYHQQYYKNNPNQGYCAMVISPKLAKFRKKYKEHLKTAKA